MCFLDLRPRDDPLTKSMNMHSSEIKNNLLHSVEFVLSTSDMGQHEIKPKTNLLEKPVGLIEIKSFGSIEES